MRVIYKSKNYDTLSSAGIDAYIRATSDGDFFYIEVPRLDGRYTILQARVCRDEIPEGVAAEAIRRADFFPSYVSCGRLDHAASSGSKPSA